MSGFLSAFDFSSIISLAGYVVAAAGVIGAVIEAYRTKGFKAAVDTLTKSLTKKELERNALIDAMSSDTPTTDEQKKVLAQQEVSRTWRMADDTFDRMCDMLEALGVEFRSSDLRAVVDEAESLFEPEYAIVVKTPNGIIDEKSSHVFVSYGIPEYWAHDYEGLMKKWRRCNCDYVGYLTEHWNLSETQLQHLWASVGDRPKCIVNITNEIQKNEDKGVERYALECDGRFWIVERGKIVRQGAGGNINEFLKWEEENDAEAPA